MHAYKTHPEGQPSNSARNILTTITGSSLVARTEAPTALRLAFLGWCFAVSTCVFAPDYTPTPSLYMNQHRSCTYDATL